jgi:hypothetical protein
MKTFKYMNRKYLFTLLFLAIGLTLTILGVNMMLFEKPSIYTMTTGRYPYQMIVANGTIELIVGLGFILGGIIRWRNRNKIEQKHKLKKRENWLKHF